MGYSKYVGRVGALAVALGVGSMTGVVDGVALAGPSSVESSVSSDATSSGPSSAGADSTSDSQKTDQVSDPIDADQGDDTSGESVATEPEEDGGDVVEAPGADGVDVDAPEGVESGGQLDDAVEEAPTSRRKGRLFTPGGSTRAASRSDESAVSESVSGSRSRGGVSGSRAEVPEAAVPVSPAVPSAIGGGSSVEKVAVPAVRALRIADAVGVERTAAPAVAARPTVIRTIFGMLATSFGSSRGPVAPVESPVMWMVLAVARRLGQYSPETEGVSVASPLALSAAAVNSAPTAVNDGPFTVTPGTPRTFTNAELVGNDTDPDGGALKVNSVGGASGGTVVRNSDGSVTFTPTAGYTGPASFIYKVKDSSGAISSNAATVSLTVAAPTNTAPTAVNDGPFTVTPGTPRTFANAELVGNDTDPDGGALKVNSVGGASGGTVVRNSDGSVTFTPTAGYTGPASFIYKVKDSSGAISSNAATVSLVVSVPNSAPTAVNDGKTATEDQPRTFTAAELVGNDTDPDGDTNLVVHSVSGATNGTVVLNSNGTVTFTPNADFNGAASFTYKVKDSAGAVSANAATVSIAVAAVNDVPVAVGDIFTINKSVPVTFSGSALVVNDTDPDKAYGDVLKVNSVGGAVGGTVVRNADGSVTFTPNAGYTGPASFIYKVKDASGAVSANAATVTLTIANVNNAPTGATVTPESTNATTGVVTGTVSATDPDLDPLTYSVPATTAKGASVTINPTTGAFTYTPTAAIRHAAAATAATPADKQDSFTVTISDGNGGTLTKTVTVDISPANTAPTPGATTINGVTPGGSHAVTPDGKKTYTLAGAGTLRIVDVASGTVTDVGIPGGFQGDFVMAPDGKHVFLAYDNAGQSVGILKIDTATDVVTTISLPNDAYQIMKLSGDGTKLFVLTRSDPGYEQNQVSVIDTATSTVTTVDLSTSTTYVYPDTLVVSPTQPRAYLVTGLDVVNPNGSTATIWQLTEINVSSGEAVESSVPVSNVSEEINQVNSLTFSPDGTRLYAYMVNRYWANHWIVSLDTTTNTVTRHEIAAAAGVSQVGGLTVSPDGGEVYYRNTGYGPAYVAILHTATNTMSLTLVPNQSETYKSTDILVSRDSNRAYFVVNTEPTAEGGAYGYALTVMDRYGTIIATIPLPGSATDPYDQATSYSLSQTPDGSHIYVMTHLNGGDPQMGRGAFVVTAVDTATNFATPVTLPGIRDENLTFTQPVRYSPDGSRAYVVVRMSAIDNRYGLAVIDTATNSATVIPIGAMPLNDYSIPYFTRYNPDFYVSSDGSQILVRQYFSLTRVTVGGGTEGLSISAADPSTGVVSGSLAAHDADGDTLSYAIASGPSRGTVQLTAAGAFTYTPNTPTNPDTWEDSFTLSVDDGHGGVQYYTVPVTLIVSPNTM